MCYWTCNVKTKQNHNYSSLQSQKNERVDLCVKGKKREKLIKIIGVSFIKGTFKSFSGYQQGRAEHRPKASCPLTNTASSNRPVLWPLIVKMHAQGPQDTTGTMSEKKKKSPCSFGHVCSQLISSGHMPSYAQSNTRGLEESSLLHPLLIPT